MKEILIASLLLSIGLIKSATLRCYEASWGTNPHNIPVNGECKLEDNSYIKNSPINLTFLNENRANNYVLRPHTAFNLYHPFYNKLGVQDLISFPDSDIAYHAMTYYIEKKKGHITICTPLDCVTLEHRAPIYLRSATFVGRSRCQHFMEIGPRLAEQQETVHLGVCFENRFPSTPHYITLYPNRDQHTLFYITNGTPIGFSIIDHSNLPPITINKPVNSIPVVTSTVPRTRSLVQSFDVNREYIFEVRNLSPSIENHPFFAVTGSFSPIVDRPNRLFLVKTPRRIYSIVKDGEHKVALYEDTGRDDLKSINKDEDRSSFILLQTFSHPLIISQGNSDAMRFSAMPRHRYGYEKRRTGGIVTGVRAFQNYLETDLQLKKLWEIQKNNDLSETISQLRIHCGKGESYLFSYVTSARNHWSQDWYNKLSSGLRYAGIRDWDALGMSAAGDEMDESLDWEGRAYWLTGKESLHRTNAMKKREKEDTENDIHPIYIIVGVLALLFVSSYLRHKYFQAEEKEKELLSDPSSSLNP